jgi:hypothetical protein
MNVTELTIEQLKALIEDTVETKLQELMGDPDAGLELREEVKERLRRSLAAEKRGQKHISMEEVVRRLGLDS